MLNPVPLWMLTVTYLLPTLISPLMVPPPTLPLPVTSLLTPMIFSSKKLPVKLVLVLLTPLPTCISPATFVSPTSRPTMSPALFLPLSTMSFKSAPLILVQTMLPPSGLVSPFPAPVSLYPNSTPFQLNSMNPALLGPLLCLSPALVTMVATTSILMSRLETQPLILI